MVAVVGHVEYVEFLRVGHCPRSGEIQHARESFQVAAGGGAVAAVQLARLAGECHLFTALGDDPLGRRCQAELEALGVRVHAAWRAVPQRRAVCFVEDNGERTITVIGERLGARGGDPLPWDLLERCRGVYFTAGDGGALAHARQATRLVSTSRVLGQLQEAGIHLDALVGSAGDQAESYRPEELESAPTLMVLTAGGEGGYYWVDGRRQAFAPEPLPGPIADAYGCGDSFAAGLAFALGRGLDPARALRLAARCGATCLTGRGPYSRQLLADEVRDLL